MSTTRFRIAGHCRNDHRRHQFHQWPGLVVTALIGAVIMAMITNGLNILGISSFWQQVLIGTVIIAAVWVDNIKSSHR